MIFKKTYMKRKQATLGFIALVLLVTGGFVSAQAGWIGTSWITNGGTISSTNLKSNLDFLYDNKAPKPSDCSGNDEYLGWVNGNWTCVGQDTPQSCLFNGNSVSNSTQVTAYRNATVPFGQTCTSELRTCNDGVLSGSFQEASCSVVPATACALGNEIIPHGGQTTAYRQSQVQAGQVCQSEVRTCQNGTLSGSYTNQSCQVAPAATCVFNGQVVPNGQQVQAFQSSEVNFGQSCTTQNRTCTNGSLSGSYEYDSCTVRRQDPITFRHESFFELRTYTDACYADFGFGRVAIPGTCTYSYYVFVGDDGVVSERRDGREGTSSTGRYGSLAADPTTLTALCNAKGYDYLIAETGMNSFNSPGNNTLLYRIGSSWLTRGASLYNRKWSANATITCSDNQAAQGQSINHGTFNDYISGPLIQQF